MRYELTDEDIELLVECINSASWESAIDFDEAEPLIRKLLPADKQQEAIDELLDAPERSGND